MLVYYGRWHRAFFFIPRYSADYGWVWFRVAWRRKLTRRSPLSITGARQWWDISFQRPASADRDAFTREWIWNSSGDYWETGPDNERGAAWFGNDGIDYCTT